MNDIITTYTEQLVNDESEHLLFKYFPNLPEGSVVQVGAESGDLEKYHKGDCYEFVVDFFGEKKKLYLRDKTPIASDSDFNGDIYAFTLNTIEDLETEEKRI